MMSSSTDLHKLTVPQLKALCKERKVSGYSKLGKAALLEKLSGTSGVVSGGSSVLNAVDLVQPEPLPQVHETSNVSVPFDSSTNATCFGSTGGPTASTTNHSSPEVSSVDDGTTTTPIRTIQEAILATSGLLPASDRPLRRDSAQAISPSATLTLGHASTNIHQSKPAHIPTAHSPTTNNMPMSMMPPPTAIPVPCNRGQTPKAVKTANKRPSTTRLDASASVKKRKIDSSALPVLPAGLLKTPLKPSLVPPFGLIGHTSRKDTRLTSETVVNMPTPGKENVRAVIPNTVTSLSSPSTGKRFKPLVVNTKALPLVSTKEGHVASNSRPIVASCLELLPAEPLPTLLPINIPPSLSQRKRVQSWAVILSSVEDDDCKNCALVSKMFRYASKLANIYVN